MLGFLFLDHELRAFVILWFIGGVLSYASRRAFNRKAIANNISFNEGLNQYQTHLRKSGITYGWEQVFECIGAFLLSWMWLIGVGIGLLVNWVSKQRPAKWM